jgi:hypothetical protein
MAAHIIDGKAVSAQSPGVAEEAGGCTSPKEKLAASF